MKNRKKIFPTKTSNKLTFNETMRTSHQVQIIPLSTALNHLEEIK